MHRPVPACVVCKSMEAGLIHDGENWFCGSCMFKDRDQLSTALLAFIRARDAESDILFGEDIYNQARAAIKPYMKPQEPK